MSDKRSVTLFLNRVHMLGTEINGILENVLNGDVEEAVVLANLDELFLQLDIVEQATSDLGTILWDEEFPF
jgi:hypothetical protein